MKTSIQWIGGARSQRRGVLLLVSLVLLSLFLLLGTTFIIMSRVDKTCRGFGTGVNVRAITEDASWGIVIPPPAASIPPNLPGPGSDFVEDYPFLEFRDSRGLFTYGANCLLTDKYGDKFISRSIELSDPEAQLSDYVNPLDTSFPFVEIVIDGGLEVDVTVPNEAFLAGRVIALVNGSQQNAVYRIIAEIEDGRYLAHPVNPNAVIDLNSYIEGFLTPTILGREFTGDPLAVDDPETAGNELEMHESYDAADERNFFLGWLQPEAKLGPDHIPDAAGVSSDAPVSAGRYIVPSFHRPDWLLAGLKEEGGNGQDALERWLGFDNSYGFYSFPNPSLLNLMRPMGRITWADDVDWTKYGLLEPPSLPTRLPHPNFTGSNEDSDGNSLFDPINGPWDVDNDGDGIADSVWIDIGIRAVTIDGTVCKPLVAILLLDLDGRINLNAHGNTAKDTFGEDPIAVAPDTIKNTGVRYAGANPDVTPPIETHAATGQGVGVAEIDPVLLLEPAGTTNLTDLLKGNVATAGGTTASGIWLPELKTEGRYGDSVNGSENHTPSPGRRGVNDNAIDAGTGTRPRDHAAVDEFAADTADGRRQRTPIDVWGTMTVAQDQLGQPFFARPDGTTAWQADRIDDPYDISLGRTAPRPSGHFDPRVDPTDQNTLNENENQDNLFSQTQLARLLNLYDRDFDEFSGRIPALLGNAAEVARLTATTESWDTPAVTVPLHTLNKILELTDQAFGGSDSLVSWDVQMGIRMDINRPFGNGLDDDGDGIVDEPGENEAGYYGNLGPYATTNLCNGRDLNVNARQLFARHLYCLTRVLCPSLGAAEVAQFAVNVVDFRDSDSIMTRFQYDETFTEGSTAWNTDADSPVVWGCERPELLITEVASWRNIEETGGSGSYSYADHGTGGLVIEVYHPWTGQTNQGNLAHSLPAELATDVSNCFGPASSTIDLAKTHDDTADGSPVFQVAVLPNKVWSEYKVQYPKIRPSQAIEDAKTRGGHIATITSAEELAEVQRQISGVVGGNLPWAWIGLVDSTGNADWEWVTGEPVTWTNWNSTEGGPGAERWVHIGTAGEWYDNPDWWAGYPYILEIPNPNYPEDITNAREAIQANPAWPTNDAALSRVIYFSDVTATALASLPKDADGKQWKGRAKSGGDETATLGPGQCGIIAGPLDYAGVEPGLFVNPIVGETYDPMAVSGLAFAAGGDCDVRKNSDPHPITIGFSDTNEKTPLAVTEGLSETVDSRVLTGDDLDDPAVRKEEFYRKTVKRLPKDLDFGPLGALVCCVEASGSGDGLRLPKATDNDDAELVDASLLDWIAGERASFVVLLRRLADPTNPYDATTNPYLTIDSMVVHEQGVIGPHATDSPNDIRTLISAERGSSQVVDESLTDYENDIWKQSDDDINPSSGSYTAFGNTYDYCGKRSTSSTISGSLGYRPSTLKIPGAGEQGVSPWPWFAWFDREFASLGELLLVPGSSPATLLRDHTTRAPFGGLFFGGGSPTAPSDPAARLGILEFLRVPSRFADAETPLSTADAVAVSQYLEAQGGKPLYLPPHNYLSHFREPGRVNLNTLASPLVWKAIDGQYQTNVYEDEGRFESVGTAVDFVSSDDWEFGATSPLSGNWRQDTDEQGTSLNDDLDNNNLQAVSGDAGGGNILLKSIVSSRHGWPLPDNDVSDPDNPIVTQIAGAFDRVLNHAGVSSNDDDPILWDPILWFDRPFQSGWRDDDGDPETPAVFDANYSLLTRREGNDFAALSPGDTKAIEFLFRSDADPAHKRPQGEPTRNPYFWYRDIIRYANKVTCRSNVFAVWTTVGFFTLDENERLSAEYVSDSGESMRPKRFQIIDRSLPVGYNQSRLDIMNATDVETFQFYHQ